MKQPEIRIDSPEAEINFNSLKNLEDYTVIIPQMIEKEKENKDSNVITEQNIYDPNLEFSFGKDLKKQVETNRLNTDYIEKKEVLSDNLSNYQLTDSVTNIIENEQNNKKMKLIKEKFISNFKSKDRNESLERALTLFEKFHNNLNTNTSNNMSFYHKLGKPFKYLTSQSTNSLSIIDKKLQKKNEINKVTNKIDNNNHSLNTIKSNEDFFKYKIRKISEIIKEDEIDNKKKINETTYDKRTPEKKIFNLKANKSKGIFIRKVIREEKYFIDDDGTEKLIGIKQSTFDTQNNKKKIKKINVNKINNEKNKTLFNKKKFAEYIKDKIKNKKKYNSSFPNKISNNDNNNKNIEINTEFINNKNINNDNCNNIKIVINKINKINSNPKINLNFIKKYKNGIKNLQQGENKENISNNINNIKNKENSDEKNDICKTELNRDNKMHIIKVGKSINQSKKKLDILNNHNINNQLNKYHHKIKINIPPMGKLKLIKCEKNNNSINKIPFNIIKGINTNRPIQRKRDLTKRNYSFKEIRNLSKNSDSNKYIFTKHIERHEIEKNKNMKNTDSYKSDNINDKLNFKKYLIDTFNKKNKFNHNFYESKSFSLQNKLKNPNNKFQNNLMIDCHTPNSNRMIFYKYNFDNNGNDIRDKSNNYLINTSFSNIYGYNNTLN